MTISRDQSGGWGKYQTAEEMEINRKYEYDPEFVPFISKWLGLSPRPPSVVVDVGCGSGYFTKIIAQCMKEKGKVIGIDPDRKLIQDAKRYAKDNTFRVFTSKSEAPGKSHSKVTTRTLLSVM